MDSLQNSLNGITSDVAECAAAIKRLRKGKPHSGDCNLLSSLLDEFADLRQRAQACVTQYDSQADLALNNLFDDPLAALQDQYESGSSSGLTSSNRLSPLHISVTMLGTKFPTIMHAFQASKVQYDKKYADRHATDIEEEQKTRMKLFAQEDLPTVNLWGSAKGSIDLDVSKWDDDKTGIMRQLLMEACKQNSHVSDTLDSTVGEIYEDALPDLFWGYASGTGLNMIGKLWKDIRDNVEDCESTAETTSSNKKRKNDV